MKNVFLVQVDMIISEYGIEVWQNIVSYDALEVYEWKDAVLYPDETFFAMVDMVVTLPELNSEKVQQGKRVLNIFSILSDRVSRFFICTGRMFFSI